MTHIFVVGGHGYVGSRIPVAAAEADASVQLVTRHGGTRFGRRSVAWADFLSELPGSRDARIIWLLDGAKHDELARLTELLGAAAPDASVVAVSTCTVYGNRGNELCAEDATRQLLTGHAQLKAQVEDMLNGAPVHNCVLRLGALYGIDDRGVRPDRIEAWVRQGQSSGVVTVPDPTHWRGWLHQDQAARALFRAAATRAGGLSNVVTSNLTFAQAAQAAAEGTGARIVADDKPDLCSYRVDSSRAVAAGLLDERGQEALAEATAAYLAATA